MIRFNQTKICKYVEWGLLIFTLFCALTLSLLPYEEIIYWYQNLNPHFYKNDEWTTHFFTFGTFKFSKIYSWILVIVSLIFVYFSGKESQPINLPRRSLTFKNDAIIKTLIFCCGMFIWWFWQQKAAYSTDEVFSAVHFANKPFIQVVSYYPLPNNHIFFNAINHWFIYVADDLVFTGRLISGLSISLLAISVYSFSGRFFTNKALRFSIVIFILTVFPIMGFSTQARGYGLHLLLGWIAFTQIYSYSKNKNPNFLTNYAVAIALGVWTIPSFLYFWVGISVPYFVTMVYKKKFDFSFIFTNFKIIWVILVLYLPVVIFSGWKSILANKYVTSQESSTLDFIHEMFSGGYFRGLLNEWLYTPNDSWFGILIFFLSIILFLIYRKKYSNTIVPYALSLVMSFLLMTLLLKKFPFYRNMVSHCLLYWIVLLISVSQTIILKNKIVISIWIFCLLFLASFFTYKNFEKFPFQLYYYDVNTFSASLQFTGKDIFTNKKVFIEDESFFWQTPISQHTSHIILGGKINVENDIIVIENHRSSKIDTSLWKLHNTVSETQFWMKK